MHSQQSQGIVRLKIPASVKSKGKRPTEEPLTQIQHFFSNSNTRQRNQSQKDELLRGPPTPNLQFIKQNKMRQAAQSSGQAAKLVIHKSLNEYDDIDDETTTHQSSRVVCPSHPNKKAKYFLASNTNVRFCTKCAITMAEREPILDEQKYHKITEIDKFRETIKIVKQDILEREPEANELADKLDEGYRRATSEIDQHFDIIFQTIKAKHNEILKSLQTKYNNSKATLKAYKQDILNAGNAMDKYLFDVNRNYEDIVQDLSTMHFNQIMDQYQAKICDYMEKVSNPPMCQFVTQNWVAKLTDIKDILRRVSLEERPHISRSPLQRKENMMHYTNQGPPPKNKSKTPDRLTR